MGALCGGNDGDKVPDQNQHDESKQANTGIKSKTSSSSNDPENDQNQLVKILFLGPGGSGKSTIFKQLKLRLTNSYEKVQNRQSEAHSIHSYIVDTIKHNLELIRHKNDDNHIGPEDTGYDVYFEDLSAEAQLAGMYFIENENVDQRRFEGKDDEIVQHIRTLWNETKFRDVFQHEVRVDI